MRNLTCCPDNVMLFWELRRETHSHFFTLHKLFLSVPHDVTKQTHETPKEHRCNFKSAALHNFIVLTPCDSNLSGESSSSSPSMAPFKFLTNDTFLGVSPTLWVLSDPCESASRMPALFITRDAVSVSCFCVFSSMLSCQAQSNLLQ